MNCPQCNQVLDGKELFCTHCGTSLEPISTATAGVGAIPSQMPVQKREVMPEQAGKRVIGYLVDSLPAFALGFLSLIPLVGILFGVLLCVYWALRDITGASLGKMVTGSFVVNSDGLPSSGAQRIGRNLLFALPGLFGLIPFVGWVIELPLIGSIMILEAILLFTTGRRLGDRLAGTTVVQRIKN